MDDPKPPDAPHLRTLAALAMLPGLPELPETVSFDDPLVLDVVDRALDRRSEHFSEEGLAVARRALYVMLTTHPDAMELLEALRKRERSGVSARRVHRGTGKPRKAAR
jgi:hypothetical protein